MPQLLTRAEEYRMRVQAAKLAKAGVKQVLKPRRKGSLPASAKVDLLAKAEFEPDNSRIGCESRGMQTQLDFATLAAIWIYEWHTELWDDGTPKHKMLRRYLPTVPQLPTVPFVIVRDAVANGYTLQFARDMRASTRGTDHLAGESHE